MNGWMDGWMDGWREGGKQKSVTEINSKFHTKLFLYHIVWANVKGEEAVPKLRILLESMRWLSDNNLVAMFVSREGNL